MIISDSADHLINTAILLIQCTSNEDNFLQVHGGMHFGKVIKRNNNYFGSAINLTSRITSKAEPGTYWCSADFVTVLSEKDAYTFESKGKYRFKNVSEENEVMQLILNNPTSFYIDPVCRMLINDKGKALCHPTDPSIFFCSQDCFDTYARNRNL